MGGLKRNQLRQPDGLELWASAAVWRRSRQVENLLLCFAVAECQQHLDHLAQPIRHARDLVAIADAAGVRIEPLAQAREEQGCQVRRRATKALKNGVIAAFCGDFVESKGRASCRERVCK